MRIEEIRELAHQGWTKKAVAHFYGIQISKFHRILKELPPVEWDPLPTPAMEAAWERGSKDHEARRKGNWVRSKKYWRTFGNVTGQLRLLVEMFSDMPYSTVLHRLRAGHSIEEALLEPDLQSSKHYEYNGESGTVAYLTKKYGVVSRVVVTNRICRGWDLHKALTTPLQAHGGARTKKRSWKNNEDLFS